MFSDANNTNTKMRLVLGRVWGGILDQSEAVPEASLEVTLSVTLEVILEVNLKV